MINLLTADQKRRLFVNIDCFYVHFRTQFNHSVLKPCQFTPFSEFLMSYKEAMCNSYFHNKSYNHYLVIDAVLNNLFCTDQPTTYFPYFTSKILF